MKNVLSNIRHMRSTHRILFSVLMALLAAAVITAAVYAAVVFSQSVGVQVVVTEVPGGGGGSGGDSYVFVYSDAGCTQVLTNLSFTYQEGYADTTLTSFMKAADVALIGGFAGKDLTLVPSAGLSGVTIVATLGIVGTTGAPAGVFPLYFQVSGGAVGSYSGNIVLSP